MNPSATTVPAGLQPSLPATGRAAIFTGPGRAFELRDVPLPDLEPGAALLRVRLATVCGSDVNVWSGRNPVKLPEHGYVIGHEMVASVAALGAPRDRDSAGRPLAVGDRVVFPYFFPCGKCRWCLRHQPGSCPTRRLANELRGIDRFPHFVGGFAEYYYLRPSQAVFRVPDALPDEWAATTGCAVAQALHGLREARLSAGETVVIQGAGGLGLSATVMAKALGAQHVVVCDAIPERLRQAKAFGADTTIDVTEMPDSADRIRYVQELTGGRGSDLALEVVGKADAVAEGVQMVRPGGRYLTMGCLTPGTELTIDVSKIVWANLRIIGACHYDPMALDEALTILATQPVVRDLPLVSHTLALDDLDRAFELAAQPAAGHADSAVMRVAVRP